MRAQFTPYPELTPAAAPPEDYQHIQTSPAMFGGATAEALEKAGAQFKQTGTEFLNQYDQLAATDAYTQYQNGVNDLMYGSPEKGVKGYLSMTGEEAMKALPNIRARMDKMIGDIKGGLMTTTAGVEFERASRRLQAFSLEQAGRHYDQAAKTWGVSTQDGALASNERGLASTYNDDAAFEHMREDMRGAAVQRAQLLGQNPVTAIGEADSRAVQARLNGALAQRDFATADRIFKQYGSLLDDKQRPTYQSHIHSGLNNSIGNDILLNAQGKASVAPSTSGGFSVGGAIPKRIAQVAQDQNVDPTTALTTAQIESSMGQNLGSRGNIFQLGNTEWSSVGGGRMGDPDTDIKNGVAFLGTKKQELTAALGRDPQPWEIYLAHQQGTGGAVALLSNPDKPAGQVVPAQNISANGGNPNAPASAFTGKWRNTFNQTASRIGGADQAGPTGTDGFGLAAGDSIAVQQIKHGVGGTEAPFKSEGLGPAGATARVGDAPQQVLARIKTLDRAPATVFLSSGASNNPADAGYVGDQIEVLKEKGAQNIVVPGVGPGVRDADAVNASLKSVVEQHGGIFFQPDVKWQKDGVHPAEVDKVRQQGLDALVAKGAAAPSPDQLVQPGAPTTPPAPKPPGMDDLARAEAELAQRHAQTIMNIENDPRSAANPEAAQHALQKADVEFRSRQMAITAQKQGITAARNAAADGYVQRMMKGPIDSSIVSEIADDPHLDRETRENLWSVYTAHTKTGAEGDAAKYGPKFFDYYQRVTAADNDPNKIRDPSQLYALAVPKPDGSQDLTLSGVDKLRQELAASHAPEKVGESKMRDGALAYAKHQLSFEADYGMFKLRDPKGEDAFNVGFLPAFFDYYDKGIAAGKSPNDLMSKDSLDKLIQPFKRTPDQMMRDRLAAGTEGGQSQAAPGQVDLATQEGILRAYRDKKITREQASQELIKRGIAVPDPAAQPAAPFAR